MKTGLTGSASDAISGNTSGNDEDGEDQNNIDDMEEEKDDGNLQGNALIMKQINDIFKEVSEQIENDAYVRIKYLKKVNKSSKKEGDFVDEIGI